MWKQNFKDKAWLSEAMSQFLVVCIYLLIFTSHMQYILYLHRTFRATFIASLVCIFTVLCTVFVGLGKIRLERAFSFGLAIILFADLLQYLPHLADEEQFLRFMMHTRATLFIGYRNVSFGWKYK